MGFKKVLIVEDSEKNLKLAAVIVQSIVWYNIQRFEAGD